MADEPNPEEQHKFATNFENFINKESNLVFKHVEELKQRMIQFHKENCQNHDTDNMCEAMTISVLSMTINNEVQKKESWYRSKKGRLN